MESRKWQRDWQISKAFWSNTCIESGPCTHEGWMRSGGLLLGDFQQAVSILQWQRSRVNVNRHTHFDNGGSIMIRGFHWRVMDEAYMHESICRPHLSRHLQHGITTKPIKVPTCSSSCIACAIDVQERCAIAVILCNKIYDLCLVDDRIGKKKLRDLATK